jgi:hypothetical protein
MVAEGSVLNDRYRLEHQNDQTGITNETSGLQQKCPDPSLMDWQAPM